MYAEGATNEPSVSVIICTYDEGRWDALVEAIASVQRQQIPAREIIVAVDHNPPLLECVRTRFADVVTVENERSPGAAETRNSGVAVAKGAVVAFLDDDATAEPDWLTWLIKGYKDPHVLGVGGLIEPIWLDGQPIWFPKQFYWVIGCTYHDVPVQMSAMRNLIAANMSVRRDLFREIGGFRTEFTRVGRRPFGCEETELCIRSRQRFPRGIFLYEPQAKVRHRVPTERTCWSYFRAHCYDEGLAKALLSRFVGAEDGLASERTYIARTLPCAIMCGLAASAFHRDLAGLSRASAIVIGAAIATVGYLVGRILPQSPDPVPEAKDNRSNPAAWAAKPVSKDIRIVREVPQ